MAICSMMSLMSNTLYNPGLLQTKLETFTNLVKVTGVKNWLVGMAHQIHQFLYPIYHCSSSCYQ